MTKKLFKIISTNWIHLVGFYLATYLTIVVGEFFDPTEGWEPIVLTGFVAALMLFIVYGYVIIGWFYLAILIMDIGAFSWKNNWTKRTLILEWIIISTPFIFWAVEYKYWLWITLSVSLLLTQLMRARRIEKIKIQSA